MNPDPLAWLAAREASRRAEGLRRSLAPRSSAGDGLLDLASNDYLGLARHPLVVQAGCDALSVWGAGSTGSRLVTGSTALHESFEADLAAHTGFAAALTFSSGYLANLGAVTALASAGDLVVSDATNHASVIDACRLSGARVAVVPHRSVAAVAEALSSRTEIRALVVTDAVFSVDGDLAPLASLLEVCRSYGAVLVVDEAHSLGVVGDLGRGAAYEAGLAGAPDVVLTVTLSKALGSQGGAVVASQSVIDHLIDTARSFIFDTGLAPACVAAADAALSLITKDSGLSASARVNARLLASYARELGLETSTPAAAVVPVVIGEPTAALAAQALCASTGVRVGCFRPPSVPDGRSRLRLTARADLSGEQLAQVDAALTAVSRAARP
ncbi:MAG: 8-amino-7-oxononanoate synthase [Frankiales bacterium]|nr:8-amino-7-oxononanoate synthase [Frankiales bacterium]